MPEVDPALRIDGKFQRWEYASILNDDFETYRPYEQEWRTKADKWFASKPGLAELVPKLRELWGSFREGQKLVNGPILKHVHDVNGLSLPAALEFRDFIQRGSTSPSPTLARALFPDIGRKLDARVEELTKRLGAWGFDESNISPFTGRLVKDGIAQYRGYRDLWRDASVMSVLERPKPVGSMPRRHRTDQFSQPALLTFHAPLEPQAEAKVSLEFDTPVQFMSHPMSSSFSFGGLPELTCVFPSPRDVPVTITIPGNVQPIIAPAPKSVTLLEDGVRQFKTELDGNNSVLHLVAVGFAAHSNAYIDRFSQHDSKVRADLEALLKKTTNLTVRPLLMGTLYRLLLQQRDAWAAHHLGRKLKKEHPGFDTCFKAIRSHIHQARDARELVEWVEAKGFSPRLETKEDFNRLLSRAPNNSFVLKGNASDELARGVLLLDDAKLEVQEQLGKRFILCQARVDTQKNLAALLKLATENPDEVLTSVRLIEALTIKKSAVLSFVIAQIDSNIGAKKLSHPTRRGFVNPRLRRHCGHSAPPIRLRR